jgi:antirestriction protein
MMREYDQKPFDPEAPVERPANHVYLNNPRRRVARQIDAQEHDAERSEIGTLMHNWHTGQGDPVYMVGSFFIGGDEYPDLDIVSDAIGWLEKDARKTKKRADKAEARRIIGYLQDELTIHGYDPAYSNAAVVVDTSTGQLEIYPHWDIREALADATIRRDSPELFDSSTLPRDDRAVRKYQDMLRGYAGEVHMVRKGDNEQFELGNLVARQANGKNPFGEQMESNPRKRTKKNADRYYAQPYSPSATGFYFDSLEDFNTKFAKMAKRGVEEFELQFIDGSADDSDLFRALEISQGTIDKWFEEVQPLPEHEKAGLYVMFSMMGERDLDEAIQKVQEDNPVVFEGNIKDYAYDYIDSTGSLDNAVKNIAESREKLRNKKQFSEYEQFINNYFDYDSYGRDYLINADSEEAERFDGMSDQEVGESLVEDLGWDGIGDENINNYFDYDAYVRDLEASGDAREIEFAGKTFVFNGNM